MSQLSRDKTLARVDVCEGAEFLSGFAGSQHNHPMMFAGGAGPVHRIFVVSRHRRDFFEMHELDKALAAYCEELCRCGYEPPAVRVSALATAEGK